MRKRVHVFSEYNSLYFIRLQEYSGDIISSFQLEGTELQLIDRHGSVIQSSSGEKVEGKVNIPQSLLEGEMYNQVTTKGNKTTRGAKPTYTSRTNYWCFKIHDCFNKCK